MEPAYYMLNASNYNLTMFATSKASPKIYGLNESSTLPEGDYTLPYWIEKGAEDHFGSTSIRVTR